MQGENDSLRVALQASIENARQKSVEEKLSKQRIKEAMNRSLETAANEKKLRKIKMDDLILANKVLQERLDALAAVKPKPVTKEENNKAETQRILAENIILEKQLAFLQSRSMAKETKDAKTSIPIAEGKLLTPKTEVQIPQGDNVKQASLIEQRIPTLPIPQDMVTPLVQKKPIPQKKPKQKSDEDFDRQEACAKSTDCSEFIKDCYIILEDKVAMKDVSYVGKQSGNPETLSTCSPQLINWEGSVYSWSNAGPKAASVNKWAG
jgi:hypothetical protein